MLHQKAFVTFLINSGRVPVVKKTGVSYICEGKETLHINYDGSLNKAMKKRYELFLELWLKRDKTFVEELAAQYRFNPSLVQKFNSLGMTA